MIFYPMSPIAHTSYIGEDKGKYHNINIPFNTDLGLFSDSTSKIGDAEYVYICKNFLFPIIKDYNPELIFISCGFDSAKGGIFYI
jgi:histone deacetylase 4/5